MLRNIRSRTQPRCITPGFAGACHTAGEPGTALTLPAHQLHRACDAGCPGKIFCEARDFADPKSEPGRFRAHLIVKDEVIGLAIARGPRDSKPGSRCETRIAFASSTSGIPFTMS